MDFDPKSWLPCLEAPDREAMQQALADLARNDAAEFQTMLKTRSEALRSSSGIPAIYADVTMSSWTVDASATPDVRRAQALAGTIAARMVSQWAAWRTNGRWLALTGTEGTGKTMLACIIGNGAMHLGAKVKYVSASEASSQVRYSFGPDAKKTERALIEGWVGCDLLILDELGAQSATPHDLKVTWSILDGRYLARKPTIVITNFALAALDKQLGPHMVGRIMEMANEKMRLDMIWPSWRRRAHAA